MKKLVLTTIGMALSMPLYAWDGGPEDMNTMDDNMSSPVVRVVKSYPGMFRGWSDNNGFRHGGYVSTAHIHVKPKTKVKHKAKKRRHVKRFKSKHIAHNSSVCIAKCYCKH